MKGFMMKKIYFSLSLILLLSGVFTGCSNNSKDVDIAAPEVTLQSPESGDIEIAKNVTVTAAFNKSVVGINGSQTAFTIQKVGSFGIIPAAVSYNDTTFTATLDPDTDLDADSVYVVTIIGEVKSRNGIEIDPVSWTFTTSADGDLVPPEILSKTPDADGKYILPDSKINVVFSEILQSTSLISENFYLMKGSVIIPSTITSAGTTVTLTPAAALEDWTDYTVTITDGIKDVAGNSLSEIIWTFKTDDQNPPFVKSRIPDTGESDVPTNAVVTVIFSESVKSYTIQNTGTSFVLKKEFGGTQVTASVVYNDMTKTATLTPGAGLESGVTYHVYLTEAIKDSANLSISPIDWTFTTSSTADTTSPAITFRNPEINETMVETNPSIIVRFNENVNGINNTNFILEPKELRGDDTVTYNSSTRTATLTPSMLLSDGTEYTVTLTSGVEDISGNDLTLTTWTFLTKDDTRPTVVSQTPADAIGNVGVNTSISAEFSEKILDSTLTTSTFKVDADGSAVSGEVAYDSFTKIATFNPDTNLQFSTTYTVTLTNGITDLFNNKLNQISWSFTTGTEPDTTPPFVSSEYPAKTHVGADISPNTSITVTFSEPVTGVTSSNVVLKNGTNTVSTQLNYDSLAKTVTLLPDATLSNNTTYTVVVGETAGIKDAAGVPFGSADQWNFTTAPDSTFPIVINKTPAPGMPDLPGNTLEVTALFSEDVSGVDFNSVRLRRVSNSAYVACSVLYTRDTATKTYKAVMIPSAAIMDTGDYAVELTSDIKDAAGNSVVAPLDWIFSITAIDSTPPTVIGRTPKDETIPARWTSNKVQVVFSEDVKNVSATSFFVTKTSSPSTHLSSVVTYSKGLVTAELLTDEILEYNTSYTAHLTAAITDRAGLPIQSTDLTWVFITDPDTNSPTVEGRIPANNSNGVPVSALITATFSEPIQNYSNATFYLDPSAAATVTYDADSRTLTLSPTGNLVGSTTYTVHLTDGITDLASSPNNLANISWQFTTQNTPDTAAPIVSEVTPGGSGVIQTTDVVVKFNEDVLYYNSKIILSTGGVAVGAKIAYVNTGGNYTATLTPDEQLDPSKAYLVSVRAGSTGIKDTSGNTLSNGTGYTIGTGKVTSGGTGTGCTVAITSVSPGGNITGLNTSPTAGGSGYVLNDILTIAGGTSGTCTVVGVTGGAVTAVSNEKAYKFTTIADTTNPTVIARYPDINTTGIELKPVITVTFSEPVTGVSASSITITPSVTHYVFYDAANRTATITLNTNLTNNTTYTVGLTSAIIDKALRPLTATSWSFVTSNLPYITSTSVTEVSSILTNVILNFSKAMNPEKSWVEITDAVSNYPPISPGAITWNTGNTTATIALAGKLRAGVLYTVKLYGWGGTFEDTYGNILNQDIIISGGKLTFTSAADNINPVIISRSPSGLTVGRNMTKIIVRFSEPMDPIAGTATLNGTSVTKTLVEGNRTVIFSGPKLNGTGYSVGTGLATSGGSGSGCTVNITSIGATGNITGIGITNAGGNYSVGDVLSITTGGTLGKCTVTSTSGWGWPTSDKVTGLSNGPSEIDSQLPAFTANTLYTVVLSNFADLAGKSLTGNSFTFTTGTSVQNSALFQEGFETYSTYPSELLADHYYSGVFNTFKNLENDSTWVYTSGTHGQITATRDWIRTTCLLAYPTYVQRDGGGDPILVDGLPVSLLTTPDLSNITKASDFLWNFGEYSEIELITAVPLTASETNILSFKMLHERLYNKNDRIEVYASSGGTSIYTKLNSETLSMGAIYRYDYSMADNNPAWQTHYFDLTGYSGSVKVKLRSISAGDTGGNIFIDDVRITKY